MKLKTVLPLLVWMFVVPATSFAVGAIAVDDEAGSRDTGYGLVTGLDSPDEAYAAALAVCQNEGNENCRTVSWFESCGAYAASSQRYGAGWGATADDAENMALEKCGGGCSIIVSECE